MASKIATYTGLALLVFAGAALDSRGMAGWVAVAGVLAGFGLLAIEIRADKEVPSNENEVK